MRLFPVRMSVILCLGVSLFGVEVRADEAPQVTEPVSTGANNTDRSADRPGQVRKTAGAILVASGAVSIGLGVYLTARNHGGHPDPHPNNRTNTVFLAAGVGISLVGALLYKSGMDAYRDSFLPTQYVVPVVAPNELGVALTARF